MATGATGIRRGAYAVFVEGLGLDAGELDARILTAARQAINKAADRARTAAAKEIERQVNFPSQYLAPSTGRLAVVQRASNENLEARVRGQQRATSLARFAKGGTVNTAGVTVQVQPGHATEMKKAFLIKLKKGSANVETAFNMGLAVRLKPGETLRNKAKAIKAAKGLYLLYGPSVDQVFRTVAEDISPETTEFLDREFNRLMDL